VNLGRKSPPQRTQRPQRTRKRPLHTEEAGTTTEVTQEAVTFSAQIAGVVSSLIRVRYSILPVAVLLFLPWYRLSTELPLGNMLGNLVLDLTTPQVAICGFLAGWIGWSATLTCALAFHAPGEASRKRRIVRKVLETVFFIVPVAFVAVLTLTAPRSYVQFGAGSAGVVASYLLFQFMIVVVHDSATQAKSDRPGLFTAPLLSASEKALRWVSGKRKQGETAKAELPRSSTARRGARAVGTLAKKSYVVASDTAARGLALPRELFGKTHDERFYLLPDNALALLLLVLMAAVYLWGLFRWNPNEDRLHFLPLCPLAYVLALLLGLNYVLSLLAYLFDRIRIPVLIVPLAWAFFGYGCSSKIHSFDTLPRGNVPQALDADLLRARGGQGPVVIVCASGGGIQAAAWTSLALTSLSEDVPGFRENLKLVAAVSGGSVGAAFFLDGLARGRSFAEVRASAVASSLSATVYGLIYRDLPRLLIPPMPGGDRGHLLEESWRIASGSTDIRPMLSFGARIRSGDLPAVALNATVLETGERLVMCAVPCGLGAGRSAYRAQHILRFYPKRNDYDVDLFTAARLSATFPYISPAAHVRDDPDHRGDTDGLHLVDGGYYDNFGVSTAIDWIRGALAQAPEMKRRKFVIVELRAFRAAGAAQPVSEFNAAFRGPASALLATRTSTQAGRNALELDLLSRDVDLQRFVFQPETGGGPLSWHLSRADVARLSAHWHSEANKAEQARLATSVTPFR